jgi:hypothetical protein
MNAIVRIIKAEIKNQAACFVFPSETASSTWARKACGLAGERSIAAGRFLAWDRFKETAIRADLGDKKPVSSILRKLFAESLIRKNAGEKFFRQIIPPRFAEEGGVFTEQIASCLSSLALWEDLSRPAHGYLPDEEDGDFAILKKEYAAFLERENLFEPSWVKPPFRDRRRLYYIFFPEAMEDFTEYEKLLKNEPAIRLVHAEAGAQGPDLFLYDSSRAEIRAAVLEILRLHEQEGLPYEEMAVSVPRLEDMEDCLMRELRLYNIPACRRSGKPLAGYGAGNIFSLIASCAANGFTFTSLKEMLLDDRLPWQHPETNRRLISFGIENNCVCGYRDKGRPVDVWEEAFRARGGGGDLGRYYRDLKRRIAALASSRTFGDIRGRFLGLYPAYLSREKSGAEGTAVLTRCMEELAGLIQITAKYPGLVPASPFGFYVSLLKEIKYVVAGEEFGVNIFPYRVAAASAFAVHFVLNSSQAAATVLYQPLSFLRQDKRAALGLVDTDASRVFFRLYAMRPEENFRPIVRISASEKTFAGWAIPHSRFSGKTQSCIVTAYDPFASEKSWWADRKSPFPARLFPVQKRGFASWRDALAAAPAKKFSLLREPFGTEGQISCALEKRLREIQWDYSPQAAMDRKKTAPKADAGDKKYIRVSATDMTKFFSCPAFWLLEKIFVLKPFSREAELLDDASLGILYHRILEKLFTRIREEDTVFQPAKLDTYFAWAHEYAVEAARQNPAFQGPLAVPLVLAQADMLAWRLRGLLRMEARDFPGYAVSDFTEKYLCFAGDGAIFVGKIDRVSVSPDGGPVIIDYKTGATPSPAACREEPDSPLEDFQAPMYVRLFEEEKQVPVKGAYFFSINQRKKTDVFGAAKKDSQKTPRELYQPTLEAFDGYAREFTRAVGGLDFSSKKDTFTTCVACAYRTVCRTTYALNSRETVHVL